MLKTRSVVMGLSALGLLASMAGAQEPNKHERKGFWGGIGLGYASLYDPGLSQWNGGLGARVMLGGTLSSKLLLALEVDTWMDAGGPLGGVDILVFEGINLAVQFYPSATGGLHLIAGAGLAGQVAIGTSTFTDWTRGGPGCVGGIGYDLRIGRSVSLTPYGTFTAAFYGGGTGDEGPGYLLNFGVALTLH
jgi:hypothetical protein